MELKIFENSVEFNKTRAQLQLACFLASDFLVNITSMLLLCLVGCLYEDSAGKPYL